MDLPFTNIRQVLSLHNKVSPEKIFLTVISDKGREELSYGEFSARCHQTANFLQEDLQIKPGDVVGIMDDQPADIAVLFMACWLVGAVITRFHMGLGVKAYFIRDNNYNNFSYNARIAAVANGQIVQLGGKPSNYLHFDTLVRGMPNTFFNEYLEPTLDVPAYYSTIQGVASFELFSQGRLLDAAQSLANIQIVTGNQRQISYLELGRFAENHEVNLNTLAFFMMALLIGGSLIIDTRFYPHAQPELFWREVASSRLHIACLSIEHIPKLVKFGREQQAVGKPIYGEGVYQQDITQLRHIYCPDAKGHDDLIKQFTAMFPFPVITS